MLVRKILDKNVYTKLLFTKNPVAKLSLRNPHGFILRTPRTNYEKQNIEGTIFRIEIQKYRHLNNIIFAALCTCNVCIYQVFNVNFDI